ncbi:MAG: hypothetical protein AUK26_00410 [Syntrophaceae bacterium CG2_30_58_14]|nr:MAG: hypothetical protein AUK26_00410 [Syntrophaceae bacterium CG2_30_58_14]
MNETLESLAGQYPDLEKFRRGVQQRVGEGYFEKGAEILVNRTPGRLDLMGGNDDYTGGLVFETTIREATLVAVQPRPDQTVRFFNPAVKALGWSDRIEFSLADLMDHGGVKPLEAVRAWINADPTRSWCAHVLGNLYFLIRQFPEKIKHGFSLYLESAVPLGKGVSSSAALEVAPMKVIAAMYGILVEGVELASWTQWVEIALTQSACGIMDQLTVVMGDEGYFVPMLCQPCQPQPLVKLPENLRLWGKTPVYAIRWPVLSMNPLARQPLWDIVSFVIWKNLNPGWMRAAPCPAGWTPNGTVTSQTFHLPGFAGTMKTVFRKTSPARISPGSIPFILILSPPSAPK